MKAKPWIIPVVIVIATCAGWYWWNGQDCAEKISYVPRLERNKQELNRAGLQGRTLDMGNYYMFAGKKFKTFDDAMNVCRWGL